MTAKVIALRTEDRIERKRTRRKRRPSLNGLRIGDLNRLFRARYGDTLPNDDSGRDDVRLMAHHLVALPGNPEQRVAAWCELRAPWIALKDLRAIVADAMQRPRRWRADRLGWRLGLTADERRRLRITTIGAVDQDKADRTRTRRERNRLTKQRSRRAAGAKPRDQYEAASIAKARPWASEGISRATWYRLKRSTPLTD